MQYYRPIPDWHQAQCVVLAIPHNDLVPGTRKSIILDYAKYLNSQGVEVMVLCAPDDTETHKSLDSASIKWKPCKVGDIWIRDWAPLLCKKNYEYRAIKFRYPDTYPYDASTDNKAGTALAKMLGIPLLESDLIWELGNFTTNGTAIIVTDQVLDANDLNDAAQLQKKLVDTCDFDPMTRVHVLKVNSEYIKLCQLLGMDKKYAVCHIDGIMRFLDAKTIIYHHPWVGNKLKRAVKQQNSLFPDTWDTAKRKEYVSTLESIRDKISAFVEELKKQFRFIPIYTSHDYPVQEQSTQEANTISDDQDYINFLRFGKMLFLPFYASGSETGDNIATLKKYKRAPVPEIATVKCSFVDALAEAGGVLNCASWVHYTT